MSPPVVATVAWLALAAVVALGVVVVLLARRLRALVAAHSDRKWEIAHLRAELGELRRAPSARPAAPERETVVDPGGRAGPREDGAAGGTPAVPAGGRQPVRPRPASPTAWRRHRGDPAIRPRRRRAR